MSTKKAAGRKAPLDAWRRVWREGFAKVLPLDGLRALLVALEADDPRLLQDTTVAPSSAHIHNHELCATGACAAGFCAVPALGGWAPSGSQANKKYATVGAVDLRFAVSVHDVDELLDPGGRTCQSRHFLNWYDETERESMRLALIPEVRWAIAARESEAKTEGK